jgi:hypothetical protein
VIFPSLSTATVPRVEEVKSAGQSAHESSELVLIQVEHKARSTLKNYGHRIVEILIGICR